MSLLLVLAVLRIVPRTDLHTSSYEFSLSFLSGVDGISGRTRKSEEKKEGDRFFLRRNSRQKNQNGAGTPPPPSLTILTTSVKPHLDRTYNQLLFMSIRQQFFIPPLNFSVSTCPHYPNDEDLNIWEESEADKLPIGEHQVRSQGLSALL